MPSFKIQYWWRLRKGDEVDFDVVDVEAENEQQAHDHVKQKSRTIFKTITL